MSLGKLIILSGPAGAGKGTLRHKVFETVKGLAYSISYTTRKPRPQEVEGQDYRFVSEECFKEMIDQNGFLEWALVHGHYYGTPKREVLDLLTSGYSVVLEIDVQGAAQVKKNQPDAVRVFICPPSREVLRERLEHRGTEDTKSITLRLKNAEAEMALSSEYDYVIVNDTIENASRQLVQLLSELIEP